MQFQTPVTDFGSTFHLRTNDKILALGSCFAQVIGKRLADRGMDVMLNPTGVLYNPASIFHTLDLAITIAQGSEEAGSIADRYALQSIDGKWYNWLAASLISGTSREQSVANTVVALQQLAKRVQEMTVLMLTFGTAHCYRHTADNGSSFIVTNCHKMPSRMFTEEVMDTAQIVANFSSILDRMLLLQPQLRIIVSVSPYRYLKYGHHRSQLSKARLLLATDNIESRYSQVHYFPAYEILNDELRDYRFYAADMVHPSEVAEQHIWQLFCNNYMDDTLRQQIQQREKVLKAAAHRPIS